MVHIKQVELSHFKSFGGTTAVPLLPGFTVVSGPNGSGKSNILDALLFALGIASSKGMRAERLPDLINHKHKNSRNTSEARVTVTFDLSDETEHGEENGHQPIKNQEWTVSRRLRLTKGGNYASTYYLNGEPCTVSQLHEELNRLRIYPEGYNVVLQGDVTRIITMNGKERRMIIDELAGVAAFDRKIDQVKLTLDSVREREERCEIITEELKRNCERLAADRVKAEKYQHLKARIQEKQQWEAVLIWKSLEQQVGKLHREIVQGEAEEARLHEHLQGLTSQISQTSTKLEKLNSHVKALGEDEQLAVASQLAKQEAQQQQLQRREQELSQAIKDNESLRERTKIEIAQYQQDLVNKEAEKAYLRNQEITKLTEQRNEAREILTQNREKANEIATASEAWVQEQANLNRQISELQKILNPQFTEQAQLKERINQLEFKIFEGNQLLTSSKQEIREKTTDNDNLKSQLTDSETRIQTLAEKLTLAEQNQQIQQDTQTRLLKEQRDKQRQLDKLEATRQAQQEAQGTYATKAIINANLAGFCGLVAQLGQVAPQYQLALETAAGGRLGNIVVENDAVASQGIAILKQQRAGRATFLPLNKIHPPRGSDAVVLRYARGFIDKAVNLIDCEPHYRNIFAYVFGNTVVFASLDDARPHLGKQRIVTLEGELLESSGAMTGGSRSNRSTLHFGTAIAGESGEITTLKQRLAEIELILERSTLEVTKVKSQVAQYSQELTQLRQNRREQQLRLEQLNKDLERLNNQTEKNETQLSQSRGEITTVNQRLEELEKVISLQEAQLHQQQQQLSQLEESQTHSEWQAIRQLIKTQETNLETKEEALRQVQTKLTNVINQCDRLGEKIAQFQEKLAESVLSHSQFIGQQEEISQQIKIIHGQITQTHEQLAQLSTKLGEAKQERDRTETKLRKLQETQQQKTWQQQKLTENQQQRREALKTLQQQLLAQEQELPNPIPEIPSLVKSPGEDSEKITFDNYTEQLEQLQTELKRDQKRLQKMEPVNMLALEEYDRTQARLQELKEKLDTIAAERTELLLRIENFTSLRFRAFTEAFEVVNENFQSIFASLSDGDGCLELENPQDPFAGGLNLIAHPKGKPVQRLSSMSGGEKSLTALSFIFSLQRYRPSPFYAFDEVDMFLDGANVERLAKMIKKQAQQAQFIVVSLRRPMIESSQRTIGVTQARGAHTQVLGIKL